MVAPKNPPRASTLYGIGDVDGLLASKAGRCLASIRRDMDGKGVLFNRRRRNEEVLALAYTDGTMQGGAGEIENLRENALNLPYRHVRWLESQATSKKMVVKVNRDAGAGQRPGGPADSQTAMWLGIALQRVAYQAGWKREIKAVIGESIPRGTSAMQIGYHKTVIDLSERMEAGKDAQSVVPEVLSAAAAIDAGEPVDPAAFEAKSGQANSEIAEGLGHMAEDPMVQLRTGRTGVAALLARKGSHEAAALAAETDGESPISDTRLTRNRVWMRKRRVGEEVGWAPHVYDTEDTPFWWERQTWTVAEVKASNLFKPEFKAVVQGYDAWNVSGVARGGQTASTDNMGSDARQAQSESVLGEDERVVEFFPVWLRRPEMKSGGIRKIVCAEWPDDFCEADDSNPNVDEKGFGLIPGFYPFYDFTPILSSITTPERTSGIPAMGVGMPQFEQIAEGNRLVHESALRHSLRLYQGHPGLAGNAEIKDAITQGKDGYFYICPAACMGSDGKMEQAVIPIQFTGNTQEIGNYVAMLKDQWIVVTGMPPAVLQGVGTAETLGQDEMGVAAGERESGALVGYYEDRTADVLCGLRGLMRGCYDDEDWIALLGEDGAKVMKDWQDGTTDEGDEITVTFGARAMAQEAVERKQLMEAITLLRAMVDPVTGLPIYDEMPLVEELFRRLDLGAPQMNASVLKTLQETVMKLAAAIKQLTGQDILGAGGQGAAPTSGTSNGGGPNPSEGDGPSQSNIGAGVKRGTTTPAGAPQGATQTF